jgi:hypothetical protein
MVRELAPLSPSLFTHLFTDGHSQTDWAAKNGTRQTAGGRPQPLQRQRAWPGTLGFGSSQMIVTGAPPGGPWCSAPPET